MYSFFGESWHLSVKLVQVLRFSFGVLAAACLRLLSEESVGYHFKDKLFSIIYTAKPSFSLTLFLRIPFPTLSSKEKYF